MRESRQSKGIMTKPARPNQLHFVACLLLGTGLSASRRLVFEPTSPLVAALYSALQIPESVAQVMQIAYGRSGNQAVDAKEVPSSALKPPAEPLQRKKPGEKGEKRAQQARKGR